MGSFMAKAEDVKKEWWVIDASNHTLGRLASEIASILRGKRKPIFTPNVDTGDFVVVVNAEKIAVTGNKLTDKIYYHHSGYPGGLKYTTLEKLIQEKPETVIEKAVWGMLPKNSIGRQTIKKLKIYAGPVHPHEAQQPKVLKVKE
ncbi:MAG: 50S ribosomal protein L13 [Deltaproteobacteria bacterium]|nr:50S ribosomal protein L13 [Deltaproteobacteria bacterium]